MFDALHKLKSVHKLDTRHHTRKKRKKMYSLEIVVAVYTTNTTTNPIRIRIRRVYVLNSYTNTSLSSTRVMVYMYRNVCMCAMYQCSGNEISSESMWYACGPTKHTFHLMSKIAKFPEIYNVINLTLTVFLPGIAQSQIIKFNEPSGFLVGLATNPYICVHAYASAYRKNHVLVNFVFVIFFFVNILNENAWQMCFSPNGILTNGWSLRHAFRSSLNRAIAIPDIIHFCSNRSTAMVNVACINRGQTFQTWSQTHKEWGKKEPKSC